MVFLNMLFCGLWHGEHDDIAFLHCNEWNDKPLKIMMINQGWSLKRALFCQNSQMGFWKEIPMSPRIGIVNAIGLWSGIILFSFGGACASIICLHVKGCVSYFDYSKEKLT
jgi:hypothetical protein